MNRRKIIILGAAGRDFHNFNTYYRNNDEYEVVAFTAAQIPDIADRRYPASLAGSLYPEGIPILAEDELEELIRKYEITTGSTNLSSPKKNNVGASIQKINFEIKNKLKKNLCLNL